jgi:alpha-beta hydrolase superfamily lysophospholipase
MSLTSERTEVLKSFDNEKIFFRCVTPRGVRSDEEKIAGLVVAVHGFGEHSGRYGHVAEFVCEQGMAFASFDLRGHGHSGPMRGDVQNLHALILDVIYVINHSLRILGFGHRSESFFFGILGHSFGGALVTYAASILSASAPPVFLSSPSFGLRSNIPLWKRTAADILPRFAPEWRVPLDIDPSTVSLNPENNQAYIQDPLTLKEVTARYGQVFLESLKSARLKQAAAQVLAPVTIAYGARDQLVDPERIVDVSYHFTSTRCALHPIEEGGHEIFNELPEARAQAFDVLGAWLRSGGRVR